MDHAQATAVTGGSAGDSDVAVASKYVKKAVFCTDNCEAHCQFVQRCPTRLAWRVAVDRERALDAGRKQM